jgi:hypothetical protein
VRIGVFHLGRLLFIRALSFFLVGIISIIDYLGGGELDDVFRVIRFN